jgi:hypothetical protein
LVKNPYIEANLRCANNPDMTIVEITGGMLRAARCTECFADEAHFTEKGMRLMADLLYEEIHEDVEARAASTLSRTLQ